MAGDVLLVHDDVAAIAAIRRLLTRQGHEVVLATSVADALIAFGHFAPRLVVLSPAVEGGRGALALRELSQHPNARHARVLLLGESVEGSSAPVAPLPLDGTAFLQTVSQLLGATADRRESHPPGAEPDSEAPAPDWWHPTAPPRAAKPDLPQRDSRAQVRVQAKAAAQQTTAKESAHSAARLKAAATGPHLSAATEPASLTDATDEPGQVLPGSSVGRAAQEQLARLIANLCVSRSSCRLELRTSETERMLWLREGSLQCATSSAYPESLLSRARADGLIDRQQEAELRAMRGASPSDLLGALKARGFLREVEVVPLVQRWTEQIAIEALSEAESSFRVSQAEVSKDALLAASPVPLLQLLPRALYRGASEASLLEALGGLHAMPSPGQHAVEIESLALSPKQMALLAAMDGTTPIGDLLLAAGLPQKLALQALHLGRLLGMVEVRTSLQPPGLEAPELDLRRLRAKLEEVQESDYFSVLGLARSAGAEEVRRAFQSLSAEFNPLKFAGHPDPSVQRQAQQVHDYLAEAARALQDDRLRDGYSRSLVD